MPLLGTLLPSVPSGTRRVPSVWQQECGMWKSQIVPVLCQKPNRFLHKKLLHKLLRFLLDSQTAGHIVQLMLKISLEVLCNITQSLIPGCQTCLLTCFSFCVNFVSLEPSVVFSYYQGTGGLKKKPSPNKVLTGYKQTLRSTRNVSQIMIKYSKILEIHWRLV